MKSILIAELFPEEFWHIMLLYNSQYIAAQNTSLYIISSTGLIYIHGLTLAPQG